MNFLDAEGEPVASIKITLITPLCDHWKVEVANRPEMDIQDNILDHEQLE